MKYLAIECALSTESKKYHADEKTSITKGFRQYFCGNCRYGKVAYINKTNKLTHDRCSVCGAHFKIIEETADA